MKRKLIGCAIALVLLLWPLSAWARSLFYANGCATKVQGSNQTAESHTTGFDLGLGYGIRVSPRLELRSMANYGRFPLDSKWAAEQIAESGFSAGVTGGAVDLWTASLSGIAHLKEKESRWSPSVFANVNYFWLTYHTVYSVLQTGEKTPWQGPFEHVYGTVGFGFGCSLSLKVTDAFSVFVEPQWVFGIGHSPAVKKYIPLRLGLMVRL